ncbi:hypothetical protein [Micromonospora sp. NPDC048830]|uniref:hypothetical protein n=1 Tax=Micromonospora sp. NPDC048830 TaxID=3364257 RepID=UPI00371EF928
MEAGYAQVDVRGDGEAVDSREFHVLDPVLDQPALGHVDDNAELAVLDAIDARAYANELAKNPSY